MSLVHVCKLLQCHGEKVQEDLDELKIEAHTLASKLGSKFSEQFMYWQNLTTNCCQSVAFNLKNIENK